MSPGVLHPSWWPPLWASVPHTQAETQAPVSEHYDPSAGTAFEAIGSGGEGLTPEQYGVAAPLQLSIYGKGSRAALDPKGHHPVVITAPGTEATRRQTQSWLSHSLKTLGEGAGGKPSPGPSTPKPSNPLSAPPWECHHHPSLKAPRTHVSSPAPVTLPGRLYRHHWCSHTCTQSRVHTHSHAHSHIVSINTFMHVHAHMLTCTHTGSQSCPACMPVYMCACTPHHTHVHARSHMMCAPAPTHLHAREHIHTCPNLALS